MSTRRRVTMSPGPILVNEPQLCAFPMPQGLELPPGRAEGDEGPAVPAGLHSWNPPHCGDSFMRIARDGSWTHEGAPIPRPAMIRLFSSILRRDPEGFVLVTPAEKLSIEVEDAPFIAVQMTVEGHGEERRLLFRTNMGEVVVAGAANPLRFESDAHGGVRPYLLVRDALWARLTRSTSLELLQCAEERVTDGAGRFGVASDGAFFPLPVAAEDHDDGP